MRILKGWTKEERKELEEAKDTEDIGDYLHAITEFKHKVTHYQYVWDKYDAAKTQDQFSIIQDIVDFYTGKAKFPEQKYYVQLIKNNDFNYLNRNKLNTLLTLDGCRLAQNYQTEFTEQEIKDIDPRYMAFAIPVEEDNER